MTAEDRFHATSPRIFAGPGLHAYSPGSHGHLVVESGRSGGLSTRSGITNTDISTVAVTAGISGTYGIPVGSTTIPVLFRNGLVTTIG